MSEHRGPGGCGGLHSKASPFPCGCICTCGYIHAQSLCSRDCLLQALGTAPWCAPEQVQRAMARAVPELSSRHHLLHGTLQGTAFHLVTWQAGVTMLEKPWDTRYWVPPT